MIKKFNEIKKEDTPLQKFKKFNIEKISPEIFKEWCIESVMLRNNNMLPKDSKLKEAANNFFEALDPIKRLQTFMAIIDSEATRRISQNIVK